MAATKGLQQADFEGIKTVEVSGTTGALHVIVDSQSAAATDTISTVTASTVTASTSSATALAANANRKNAVIVNGGANDVTIRRGTPAVAGTGIILKANGGAYEIDSTNLYKGIITCITASGSSALGIEEGV